MSGDFFVVRRGATAVPNELVHSSLSYAALALQVKCLALPAGARVGYRDLMGRGFGEVVVRKALRELEEASYRFRFRTRLDGRVRELVIVSDTPLTVDEARAEAVRRMENSDMPQAQIIECPSHPDEFSTGSGVSVPVENYRAEDPRHGGSEPKVIHRHDEKPQDSAEPHRAEVTGARYTAARYTAARYTAARYTAARYTAARYTAARYTAARLTEARYAVPRSGTAHISKDISNNSSNEELNTNQPSSPVIARPSSPDEGAGSGVVGVDDSSGVEWGLIYEALPVVMSQALVGLAARRVSGMLVSAVGAGWTPSQIYRRLNANPLPSAVSNMAGLVIHRLGEIAQSVPPGAVKNQVKHEQKKQVRDCLESILDGTSGLARSEQYKRVNAALSSACVQADSELHRLAERALRFLDGDQVEEKSLDVLRQELTDAHNDPGLGDLERKVLTRYLARQITREEHKLSQAQVVSHSGSG